MAIHLYVGEDLLDFPLPIDEVGRAHDAHGFLAVKILLLPNPISREHLVGSVTGQGEVQPVLVPEFPKLFNAIPTHAQNYCAELVQFFFGVTELVRLAGSTRGVGFGKEIENYPFPLKAIQRDLIAGVRE